MTTPIHPPADVPPGGRRRPGSIRRFVALEASAGALLLAAALVALVWANSPWGGSYQSLWHGRHVLEEDLHHWVNDALMAVFFLVVGLEIKRELVHGKLRDPRTAAMPAIAAVGGMAVPALLFLLLNAGGDGARGWGVPVATDIAFAVGVVAILGPRVPASLKLFLLTLAIVDDIGGILVIAFLYPSGLQPQYLIAVAGLAMVTGVVNRAGVVRLTPYLVLGGALWLATYESGVHAAIAGVALGLLMPAQRRDEGTLSPAERLAHVLHPWSTYLVLPVFALANAGVVIKADSFDVPGASAVTLGVMLGLVVGKTLGITAAAWLAARTGIGRLPEGATWPMMFGIAAIGGVGFTVSLFIAELAFDPGPLQDAAKLGVLAGSLVAAIVGGAALRRATRRSADPSTPRPLRSERRPPGPRRERLLGATPRRAPPR